eukprot:Hpha_TRINITY_DN2072_c0_g2::TRINITY_DN2072_c0_g2_i1::g.82932::m.82932/K16675/ZDHHC9_14_18; palmitoyltransferase ZDHHC9/14/18
MADLSTNEYTRASGQLRSRSTGTSKDAVCGPGAGGLQKLDEGEAVEPTVREEGMWVHPDHRRHREWHKMHCSDCNTGIVFPWLGYQKVSCPSCGTHNNSHVAVLGKMPSARIQQVALRDEKRLLEFSAKMLNEPMTKEMAAQLGFLRRHGDRVEAMVCGKPKKYGNVKLYCNSKLMLPPSSVFFVIPIIIAVPPYLLCFYDLFRDTPSRVSWAWWGGPLLHSLMATAFIGLIIAHFTDPGIIPKEPAQPVRPDEIEIVNGQEVKRSWCRTCHILRPPRASHCGTCDVCVDHFDHHCHVTGTCVGKRNLLPFSFFTSGILFADTFVLVSSTIALMKGLVVGDGAKFRIGVAAVWTLPCFFLMLGLNLSFMHISTVGVTTREVSRHVYKDMGNHPFKKSNCFGNLGMMCCGFFTPSLLKRSVISDYERMFEEFEEEAKAGNAAEV